MSNSHAGDDSTNTEPLTLLAGDRQAAAEHFKPLAHSRKPVTDDKFPTAPVVARRDDDAAASFLDFYHELPSLSVPQGVGDRLLHAAKNRISAGRVESGEIFRKDEDTPKTVRRVSHGYENASSRSGSEAQSVMEADLRQLWRVARRLGYLAINVVEESFGLADGRQQNGVSERSSVRWYIEDRHERGQLRHGAEGPKRMVLI
jgi:hypothetical protein